MIKVRITDIDVYVWHILHEGFIGREVIRGCQDS